MNKLLLAPLVLLGCATIPDGYKRMGDTRLCYRAELEASSGGEGSVVPGLGRTMQTTFLLKASSLVEGESGTIKLTVLHFRGEDWSGKELQGYKADSKTGLFVMDRGSSLSYTDDPSAPSFLYDCHGDKCTRFGSFAGHDVLSSPSGVSTWKRHELLMSKVFKDKHITLCL